MGEVAIRAEGLGKQYRIGERQKYKALRDTLADAIYSPFRMARRIFTDSDKTVRGDTSMWALKDVSFEINQGEVIGVIGRNGAGKSTLLKILSRITEPSEGYVDVCGRVGSLLEVGTGFHPELTGRENIYLNGSIIGMKKAEVDRQFEEIVHFAEVERFLDTPVKYYSTGMYMRLAFAVASHLETEILLVDEVLAVGDAEFQKKCFAKMHKSCKDGRTIIFVSHNMSALRSICRRGIVLQEGSIIMEGAINTVADQYLAAALGGGAIQGPIETETFILQDAVLRSGNEAVIRTFDSVEIKIRFTAKSEIRVPGLYVAALSLENHRLLALDLRDFYSMPAMSAGETNEIVFAVDSLPLLPGEYHLEIYLKDIAADKYELVPLRFPFHIVESPVYGGRKLDEWYGLVGLHARAYVSGKHF